MKAPVYPQPVNRFSDLFWPSDQEGMNNAVLNYFKVAIAENGKDKHGSKQYIYEDFEPDNTRHLEAIFKRDFENWCEFTHKIKPDRIYIPSFVESFTEKWNARLEAIKHPKIKGMILSYINYLSDQKNADMAGTESLRFKLTEAGFIPETKPEVFHRVVRFHQLPGGEEKILWLTRKADAMYFFGHIGISPADANKCFQSKNGKPFHRHNHPGKSDYEQRRKFKDIL